LECQSDGQPGAEWRAVDVLHDEIVGSDIVEMADVRMVQRGDRARLALGAIAEPSDGGLDGDRAAQARIDGFVDFTHPPRTERHHDFVRTQTGTRSEWHG